MQTEKKGTKTNTHWFLVVYDILVFAVTCYVMLFLYSGPDNMSDDQRIFNTITAFLIVFIARIIGGIYRQVWRYGGIQCYIRLLAVDGIAFLIHWAGVSLLINVLVIRGEFQIYLSRLLSIYSINLLGALALRMVYRYVFKCGTRRGRKGRITSLFLKIFSLGRISLAPNTEPQRIRVAIVGAGRVGVSLAEDLLNNEKAAYVPQCFIDSDREKIGRRIHNLPVLSEEEATFDELKEHEIQEIIFAIPQMEAEKRKELYEYYKQSGCKLKVYDYPSMQTANGKRHLREFDSIEPFRLSYPEEAS